MCSSKIFILIICQCYDTTECVEICINRFETGEKLQYQYQSSCIKMYIRFCVVVLLLGLLRLWRRRHLYRLAWQLKGPLAYPIIGDGHHFLDAKG